MYESHAADLELRFSCWFSPSKHPHTYGIPTENRKVFQAHLISYCSISSIAASLKTYLDEMKAIDIVYIAMPSLRGQNA
jgi:hypothetical protein